MSDPQDTPPPPPGSCPPGGAPPNSTCCPQGPGFQAAPTGSTAPGPTAKPLLDDTVVSLAREFIGALSKMADKEPSAAEQRVAAAEQRQEFTLQVLDRVANLTRECGIMEIAGAKNTGEALRTSIGVVLADLDKAREHEADVALRELAMRQTHELKLAELHLRSQSATAPDVAGATPVPA